MGETFRLPEQVGAKTFWEMVGGEAINGVLDMLGRYPDLLGIVRYRDRNITSAPAPDVFCAVGPSNFFETLEDAAAGAPNWRYRGGVESWCRADDLRAAAPPRYVRTLPPCPPAKGPMPEATPERVALARRVVARVQESKRLPIVHCRPVLVAFGRFVGPGCFYSVTDTHAAGDRFVEHGVAQAGDTYPAYWFEIVGKKPRKSPLLRYRHGLPYGAGYNGDLAEWYLGGYYPGPVSERHPFGPFFMLSEYVPMNFGPCKDELLDDYERSPRKRAELRVRYLDE